jgi:hypothetical protein
MTGPTPKELLDFFWSHYAKITPDAPKIHDLLKERGENVINDHIAFRTFDLAPIGVESLGETFIRLGYRVSGEYHFERKKLRALSYAHPDPSLPHVFISELLTAEFSPELRRIVGELVAQVPTDLAGRSDLFTSLPTWKPIEYANYLRLLEESEYAAWLAAFGIRANHFTVLINSLETFTTIREFNAWLVENGFVMNTSGGEVKGTPEELLEQSSIMARSLPWTFAGGEVHDVPTCYHEFARRYTDPETGELYEGFIARSADRIFESTNVMAA